MILIEQFIHHKSWCSKIVTELPGILDEVITMTSMKGTRKFVCKTLNMEDYPAKDRSGKLGTFEDADLGKLLRKIKGISETEEKNKQRRRSDQTDRKSI